MITVADVRHSRPDQISRCRTEVEIAMMEMLNNLQAKGWSQAELALALADAAEDYVMLMARKERRSN
ncbi:hypothetical protein [Rhizobium binxianense]